MGPTWQSGLLIMRSLLLICLVHCIALHAEVQKNGSKPQPLAEMTQVVKEASKRSSSWDGPTSGPSGRHGMKVTVICEDLRNGGVLGVARGVGEAAHTIGWDIIVLDARGTAQGREEALVSALAMEPDGVILIGSDATSLHIRLSKFAKRHIPLVGWHVGSKAGKLTKSSVAINVSTDPSEVARVTAMAAVVESKGQAGVVIFTDPSFEIAMTKANVMADVIRQCGECTLLEISSLPISQSARHMPQLTRQLLARYGKRWNYALAINDIYFDYAVPEFIRSGRNIRLLSAGDGSPAAFMRIQAGTFQDGTVAEPLNLQGWQLVDELNRLLSGQPVSGHITPVHLVRPDNIAFDGGPRMTFDPDNGYRDAYRRIWKRLKD